MGDFLCSGVLVTEQSYFPMKNHISIIRYLSGTASQDEKNKMEDWLASDMANQLEFKSIEELWESQPGTFNYEERVADWDLLKSKLQRKRKAQQAQWLIRAAAVILLLLGTTLIVNTQKEGVILKGRSMEPVAQFLPDGSEVFLTKGSKIKYPKNFGVENRVVELYGEAYFKVTSDPKNPFLVNTGDTKVKVTGTSFLVDASDRNKEISVQVKTGKVLFYNSETLTANAFRVGLGPGDMGIYNPRLNQLNKTQAKEFPRITMN